MRGCYFKFKSIKIITEMSVIIRQELTFINFLFTYIEMCLLRTRIKFIDLEIFRHCYFFLFNMTENIHFDVLTSLKIFMN